MPDTTDQPSSRSHARILSSSGALSGIASLRASREEPSTVARLEEAREKYRSMEFEPANHLLNVIFTQSDSSVAIESRAELLAGAHVLRGQLLYDLNERSTAREHSRIASQLLEGCQPQPGRRSADFGIALWLDEKRNEAVPHLEAAVQAGPSVWDAARWLGIARLANGDPASAEVLLRQAAAFLPKFANVSTALAEALALLNRPHEAAIQFQKAGLEWTTLDSANAIEAFQRALALDPNDTATLYLLGEIHRLLGNTDQSLFYLNRVLVEDSNHSLALASEAFIYADNGNGVEAKRLITRAVECDLQSLDLRLFEAEILDSLGDYQDEIAALEHALELGSDPKETLERKARCELRLEKWDDALKSVSEALARYPESIQLLGLRAEALYGKRQLAEALAAADTGLQRDPENLGLLMIKARSLEDSGDIQAALQVLQHILSIDSENLDALFLQGRMLVEQDPSKAESILNYFLKKQPESVGARLLLGETRRRLGKLEEAKDDIEVTLRSEPDNPTMLGTMGQILSGLRQDEEAAKYLAKAVELAPALRWAWTELYAVDNRLGRLPEFKKHVDKVWKSQIQNDLNAQLISTDVNTLLSLASAFMRIPDLKNAEIAVKKALKSDSRLSEAWTQLGDILQDAGQADESLDAYQRAIDLNRDDISAVSGKAWVLLNAKADTQKAVDLIASVIQNNLSNALLRGQYGETLRKAQEWDKAREELTEALKLDPHNGWLLGLMAQLLTEIGVFRQAAEFAESASEADPSSWIFGLLGWAWENVGRGDGIKAKNAYLQGLEIDAEDPWLKKGLANSYRLTGNWDDAQRVYQEIVESSKKELQRSSEYHFSLLGWCHYQIQNYEEAVRLLSSAISVDPDSISDYFDIGLVLLHMDRNDEAKNRYHKGFKLLKKINHDGRKYMFLHIAECDLLEAIELKKKEGETDISFFQSIRKDFSNALENLSHIET